MNARDAKIHLAELLRRERRAMAEFILALAQFDEAKRWRELEYAEALRQGKLCLSSVIELRRSANS